MSISTRFASSMILLLALAPLGCSFSTSSGSISDSISSPSKSSGSSSKSSQASSQNYADDVRDYTAGYVSGGGSTTEGLRSGLADVASRHGITNWETNPDTFFSIGMGLAKGGVRGSRYQGFRDGLSSRDASKAAAIDRGYTAGGSN